jgi:hypothetical protein
MTVHLLDGCAQSEKDKVQEVLMSLLVDILPDFEEYIDIHDVDEHKCWLWVTINDIPDKSMWREVDGGGGRRGRRGREGEEMSCEEVG